MIKKRNILIGVTAMALVLSTGAVAFAATDSTDETTVKGPGFMANLTEDQRDAVRLARSESMKEAVAELTNGGTITQDIADKLSEMAVQKARFAGLDLTEAERAALREAEAAEFESQIAALVDDGTITQDQADQMTAGKRMMRGLDLTDEQREALMQIKINVMKAAAESLVEKGTITQKEADAITTVPQEKPAEKPAAILTEDQKTALNEAMKANLEIKLSALVDDGTLTQDQADQLLNDSGAMRMGRGDGPSGPGHGPEGRFRSSDAPKADTL